MDRKDIDSAEAQTTKVAETTHTTGADISTDASRDNAKMGEGEVKLESAQPKSPKQESSTANKQRSPTPKQEPSSSRSPEQPKRRASCSPSPYTKRQRTSQSPSTSRRDHSDDTRSRPPVRAKPDDKARNRRLFGGMLSTIAAKPNQRAARPPRSVDNSKREELEKRAAERERARLKEEEDARRERELRRREGNRERYIQYDREAILAKADNERLRAKFLKTKAKPALYFKPYILTKKQKDTLNQQIDDTEVRIEKDIRKYEETHPDQPPLPWKPLPPTLAKDDSMDVDHKDGNQAKSPQVSKPSPGSDTAMEEELVSKVDGAKEQGPEQKKDKSKADDFDEDVIETSEGGVSLIY